MDIWPSQRHLSQIIATLYRIQETTLHRRNVDIIEWSLIATSDIAMGTFLGFYTGDHDIEYRDSVYAAKLDNVHIYPFADEANITRQERDNRPFANMNEPNTGEHANCCFIVQDFGHDEVEGIERIDQYEKARFFRGLACFTCDAVKRGEELTWYYGKTYEGNRIKQGYEAGKDCLSLLEKKEFIASNSQAVLAVMPKVPYTCLIAVTGLRQSLRFPVQKRTRSKNVSDDDEDDDEDDSSSGSGHEIKYQPSAQSGSRSRRLMQRNLQKA